MCDAPDLSKRVRLNNGKPCATKEQRCGQHAELMLLLVRWRNVCGMARCHPAEWLRRLGGDLAGNGVAGYPGTAASMRAPPACSTPTTKM